MILLHVNSKNHTLQGFEKRISSKTFQYIQNNSGVYYIIFLEYGYAPKRWPRQGSKTMGRIPRYVRSSHSSKQGPWYPTPNPAHPIHHVMLTAFNNVTPHAMNDSI